MHFMNVGHAYENAARYARAMTGRESNANTLHPAYREAIGHHRPFAAPATGITIDYEDGTWGHWLRESGVFDGIFKGVRTSTPDERSKWPDLTRQAAQSVRELDADLGRIVDLLVTDIVLLPSDSTGGGSASHLPGLVCLSPGPEWQINDFAESLVHEATHLNLFVADMVHGIYTLPASELVADEHRVVSAVKFGQRRPLDRAFHSAVVAVPLMWMQHRRGTTALVDQFTTSLRECCEGLNTKRDLFTPYGRLLVDQLSEFADTLDFDSVKEAISGTRFASYAVVA